MSSLSELIAKVNPGLSAGGVDSMLKLYSVDIFIMLSSDLKI